MSVLSDLEKLHAAEDFFSYLKVDFDPALLRVARLHILKRMGTYLAEKDFSGPNEVSTPWKIATWSPSAPTKYCCWVQA